MGWLTRIRNIITYPYYWYKDRQLVKQRLEELKKQDPFIYK